MKTFIIIALIASSMLLPLCLAQYTKPEDQATSCAYIAKNNNRYLNQTSDSLQRCMFCQYKYNDPSDLVYGGCATCPTSEGKCTSCISGYVLFNGKCVSCGNGVYSCTITNQNFLSDMIIQQVLSDIRNSTLKTIQQKNIEEMQIYQQYLAIRADQCSYSSLSDGVIAEMGSICKKIQNCDKIERTSTSVSCSKCKARFFFDSNFRCVNECKANFISFNFTINKYEQQQLQACSDCTYDGLCKTCPAGTVQVSFNSQDIIQNSTLQVCQTCMEHCQSCSVNQSIIGNIKCDVCSAGFFYNSDTNTCDKCNVDSLLMNKPSDSQKSSIKLIVCSGNDFSQINWSASQVTQTDALNQTFTYAIKIADNDKAFICGEGAIDCYLEDGKTINKSCLYGYALKDNNCVSCNQLAKDSILCQYNQDLKTYIPTLCKVGSKFDIPYSDSFFLQITIDQVNTLVNDNKIAYREVPDPNTWCQENKNQCKSFVSLHQKLQLNLTDTDFQGACSDCFTDNEIPDQYKKISKQDFFKTSKGQVQACSRCSDIQGAVECDFDESKQLVPKQCASSFYLDSENSCKECDKSCLECDTSSTCTSCSSEQYLSKDKKCLSLTQEKKKIDNCLSQYEIYDLQSCNVCAKHFNKTEKGKIQLCEAYQIENCDYMDGTVCKRCIQDGKQYYLKDNKCISIPQGCASYQQNGSCSVCQYGYKPVNITDVQVCVPCYQEFNNAQSFIQYDCPGKVKKWLLENDDGTPVQQKSNSMVLLFSAIYFILFLIF
ncbi:hypothetical protein ABPG72_021859 [Tetrahymena utriculariae]